MEIFYNPIMIIFNNISTGYRIFNSKKENVLATHIRISYSLYPKVGKNKEAHELSAYECH